MPVVRLDPHGSLNTSSSISLSIARPMPLREVLRLLVAGTDLSIVIDETVEGTFEGDLKGLTLRQALEAVLFSRSLDYDVRGSLLRIYPTRVVTRLLDINHLNVQRTWSRSIRSTTTIPGGAGGTSMASAVSADRITDLSQGIRSLLSASGRVHVDRQTGLVQVTDFPDRVERVRAYLEAVELRSLRQVQIEARVLEITPDGGVAARIDWARAGQRAGSPVSGGSGIHVTDVNGLIRALGEQGTVRTIASPRIMAMNNEPAVIRVGVEDVYFTPASAGLELPGPTAAAVSEGLTLTVTAQISTDGIVLLNVAPTYADQTERMRTAGGVPVPVLHVTEADTNARLRDGETLVISGLLRERPGDALSPGGQAAVTSELVVLLTPTVVPVAGAR